MRVILGYKRLHKELPPACLLTDSGDKDDSCDRRNEFIGFDSAANVGACWVTLH